MIKALINTYYTKKPAKFALFFLICLLGFTGFMRIEEILKIQLKHLKLGITLGDNIRKVKN